MSEKFRIVKLHICKLQLLLTCLVVPTTVSALSVMTFKLVPDKLFSKSAGSFYTVDQLNPNHNRTYVSFPEYRSFIDDYSFEINATPSLQGTVSQLDGTNIKHIVDGFELTESASVETSSISPTYIIDESGITFTLQGSSRLSFDNNLEISTSTETWHHREWDWQTDIMLDFSIGKDLEMVTVYLSDLDSDYDPNDPDTGDDTAYDYSVPLWSIDGSDVYDSYFFDSSEDQSRIFYDADEISIFFPLVPVPEPSSYSLLFGSLALGLVALRRRL